MGERTVFEGQHLDAGEHKSCLSRNARGALPPQRGGGRGKKERERGCACSMAERTNNLRNDTSKMFKIASSMFTKASEAGTQVKVKQNLCG